VRWWKKDMPDARVEEAVAERRKSEENLREAQRDVITPLRLLLKENHIAGGLAEHFREAGRRQAGE
jgi:hypothetical protein